MAVVINEFEVVPEPAPTEPGRAAEPADVAKPTSPAASLASADLLRHLSERAARVRAH